MDRIYRLIDLRERIMRSIAIMFVIILGLMIFAGCNDSQESSYQSVNNIDAVSIAIKADTLTPTSAVVLIRNENDYICTFGTYYSIEEKRNDKWYELPYIIKDDIGWDDLGIDVGKTNESKIEVEREEDWEWLYGSLSPGEYRIVKEADIRHQDPDINGRHYFAAEFSITDEMK